MPVQGTDDTGGSAYLEGIVHLRVEGATAFAVCVDLNRRRVVSIVPWPQPFDPAGREPTAPKG